MATTKPATAGAFVAAAEAIDAATSVNYSNLRATIGSHEALTRRLAELQNLHSASMLCKCFLEVEGTGYMPVQIAAEDAQSILGAMVADTTAELGALTQALNAANKALQP